MNRILFVIGLLICANNLAAKESAAQPSKETSEANQPFTPVTPPPGMDEPGVEATPATPPRIEAKPQMGTENPATSSEAVAGAAELPVITVRKQGDDTVEEYRKHGQLYMIRILPKEGPTKFYVDRTGDGRLERDPREGPISPVYFKLYEWK